MRDYLIGAANRLEMSIFDSALLTDDGDILFCFGQCV